MFFSDRHDNDINPLTFQKPKDQNLNQEFLVWKNFNLKFHRNNPQSNEVGLKFDGLTSLTPLGRYYEKQLTVTMMKIMLLGYCIWVAHTFLKLVKLCVDEGFPNENGSQHLREIMDKSVRTILLVKSLINFFFLLKKTLLIFF